MVLPYINMNPPQVYTCSPSWTLHPLPSLYHPSGSSQCTSPKHPVLCIEPGLATHFILYHYRPWKRNRQIWGLSIGEVYGESNMETYTTICNIDSQREFAVWLRELKQGLCVSLEGRDGREVERNFKREGAYLWLIHAEVRQKTAKFCKAIILQLKNKVKKLKPDR